MNTEENVNTEDEGTPVPQKHQHFGVFAVLMCFLFVAAVVGQWLVAQSTPDTIQLTADEKKQVSAIDDEKHAFEVMEQENINRYEAEHADIDKGRAELRLKAEKLCWVFQRAHHIPPDVTYKLDDINGRLQRVH